MNGKGGVGKSTLCNLVYLALKDAGKAVYLRDLDPQQTLGDTIENDCEESEADFILVDSPPAIDDSSLVSAIKKADRLIMPIKSDPYSVPVTVSSSEVVARLIKKGAKAYGVHNDVEKGTNFSKAAPEVLKESLKVPLLSVEIPHRQSIKRAALAGWGTLEPEVRESVFKLALEIIA